MGLFDKPVKSVKVDSVSLGSAVADAVNIFNQTVTKLNGIIKQAEEAMNANNQEIIKLQAENDALNNLVKQNQNVSNKISDLINPITSSSE